MRDISIHALGHRVGICVATRTANPNQAELLGYGAEIVLGSILKVGVLFLIAGFLGIVSEVSVLLLITGLLRTLSGGAHCSAYYRCLATSVITLAVLGYMLKIMFHDLQRLPFVVLIVILTVSLYIYWRYAPQAPLNKPLKSKAMEVKFRRLTLIAGISLSIGSIIVGPGNSISWIVAFGMLWQASTLTPAGHELIKRLDISLTPGRKGGEAECGNF